MFLKFKQQIKRTKRKIKKNFIETPFINKKSRKLIVHCCYHKVGTVWFTNILKEIADAYMLNFYRSGSKIKPLKNTDIYMQYHSCISLDDLPPYRGSHMIRDPRDVIISGYFYHLWTKEEWVHIPMEKLSHKWIHLPTEKFGHMSYQQYLNSLDREQGILAEIKRASTEDMRQMIEWDYGNPNFIEIKYEDLIRDEESTFYNIFEHYLFSESAISNCLNIAKKYSFKNRTKRTVGEVKLKSHLRSGRPGEWRDFFNDEHKMVFKNLFGEAVVKLGYEANNDW